MVCWWLIFDHSWEKIYRKMLSLTVELNIIKSFGKISRSISKPQENKLIIILQDSHVSFFWWSFEWKKIKSCQNFLEIQETISRTSRPVARIDFGEVRDSQKVDLLDPKGRHFGPHPLNPPTKTPFLIHFVAESGSFGRFGEMTTSIWLKCTPLAMGLRTSILVLLVVICGHFSHWIKIQTYGGKKHWIKVCIFKS